MKTMTSPPPPPLVNSPLAAPFRANRCKVDRVLVPIDFSEGSRKALKYALALSNEFGADLHLVHVCDFDHTPSTFEAITLALSHGELTRHWMSRLRKLAGQFGITSNPDHLHVVTGRAYHEICELAERVNADLIVTSTRGHTGLKHVLMGSTAERVVQHSPCAVLVVREREHDCLWTNGKNKSVLQLKKILVPLDFSECSRAGLEFAIPFAHFWKARLILFNAVMMMPATPYGAFGPRDFITYPDVEDCAEQSLREVGSEMLERGVAIDIAVQTGPAARQICHYADQQDVDLIVLSTHGNTGFVHAVLGSTAEHVVRYAHCPVLVVPTRKRGGKQ
jgi:universal stress protein A